MRGQESTTPCSATYAGGLGCERNLDHEGRHVHVHGYDSQGVIEDATSWTDEQSDRPVSPARERVYVYETRLEVGDVLALRALASASGHVPGCMCAAHERVKALIDRLESPYPALDHGDRA